MDLVFDLGAPIRLTAEFADAVEKEVTNWLIEHIQGTDMQAIEWINNKSGDKMSNLL